MHRSRFRVVLVAVAFSALATATGACAAAAPAPSTRSATTAPAGGLPGAVNEAERTKDAVNERSRDLEQQVDEIGR